MAIVSCLVLFVYDIATRKSHKTLRRAIDMIIIAHKSSIMVNPTYDFFIENERSNKTLPLVIHSNYSIYELYTNTISIAIIFISFYTTWTLLC